MASVQTEQEYLFSRNKIQMFDHDPGDTAANVITPDGGTTERWVDMRDYERFAAIVMSSTLTGAGITKLEIVAADDATGTNTLVIKDSGVLVADAVGDYVMEECTAEEIRDIGENESTPRDSRFVAARVTLADGADEAVATYIQSHPRFPATGLSANTIA